MSAVRDRDHLLVLEIPSTQRPRRAQVVRSTVRYLWLRVVGLRDNLRVVRCNGTGTLYSLSFEAQVPTPEDLAALARLELEDRVRGAFYQFEQQTKRLRQTSLNLLTPRELEELDRLLRKAAPPTRGEPCPT